jgi:hypothetical protein
MGGRSGGSSEMSIGVGALGCAPGAFAASVASGGGASVGSGSGASIMAETLPI